MEDVDDFHSAYVYQFPSLKNAMDWSEDGMGPTVVTESNQLLDQFKGFSVFFIKVLNKEAFSSYNPSESLQRYPHARIFVPTSRAAAALDGAEKFDASVLISFNTPGEGKAWLETSEVIDRPQSRSYRAMHLSPLEINDYDVRNCLPTTY